MSGSSPTRASSPTTSTNDLWDFSRVSTSGSSRTSRSSPTSSQKVMSQEGPSRRTNVTKKRTYAKPGTLSSLVQQRRSYLTTQETLQAVQSEKKNLLKLIEKEQPIAKQQRVTPQSELNEQCVEEQPTVEEQVQMDSTSTLPINEQSEEQASYPFTQKNTRGTTQMQSVHGRNYRKLILLNNNNQPVGPTKDVVVELSSFLGTLARNATLCPLDILDWRYMDTKDDLWTYTQEKYDITDDAKEWALEVIGCAWRRHKFDLKKLCYKPCTSHEVLLAKRPPYVPECQLKDLLKYWDSDKHKNRKKLKNPHTAGKISFALVRNDLEKKKESSISLKELFSVTRTRHPERLYKDSNEDTISKIAEMVEIEKQQIQERIQKMEEQMDEQRRTIQQDATANIISQLQRARLINADVLAALCFHSPGEANSGP